MRIKPQRLFMLLILCGALCAALLQAARTPPLIDGWTLLTFATAAALVIYAESGEDR